MEQEWYMRQALEQAKLALAAGEVPVGCVVANRDGVIVGRGYNKRETERCALAHAEVEAIAEACRRVGSWRLAECSLYVTLEPCPMCAGAILNARIPQVYFGAKDANTGSCGSVIHLFYENYGFEPQVRGGVLESECSALLSGFFATLREQEIREP